MTELQSPVPDHDETRALDWLEVGNVSSNANSLFRDGQRPVIRWIKGNGLDDVITRSAIAQATRLFGKSVDYCLCTCGIGASRVRDILAWATEPVHWWPLEPSDNFELASLLMEAGCEPRHFGYWWKWFPERVRPDGPEWILDGDMVVVVAPEWFDAWLKGEDRLRASDGDEYWSHDRRYYGEYRDKLSRDCHLYSGIVSLPPGLRYMPAVVNVLREQPLQAGHDGRTNMSEQGVIAAALSALSATPIPLRDYPFGRAFEENLDFGFNKAPGRVWGYHFGNSFRRENHHFVRLVNEGKVYWQDAERDRDHKFTWLRNWGQWGRPGWSMHPGCVQRIASICEKYAGRPMLEIGTSRGFLTSVIAERGCLVTTVDREDRGARTSLQGLKAIVVVADAAEFLRGSTQQYAAISVDLHGNDDTVWRELWPLLRTRVAPGGTLILYNSHLWRIPEWHNETGLKWLLIETPDGFSKEIFEKPLPGMIVMTASGSCANAPPQTSTSRAPAPSRRGAALGEKRPQVAANLLEAAAKTWPEDVRVHDVLCTAYENLNQREAALGSARRTVALAPHHPGYRERLSRLLLATGQFDEAELEVRKVLDVARDRGSAHHLLSLILLRRDKLDMALSEAHEAVRLDPAKSGFHHHLGALALRGGLLDDAESSARKAISLAPENGDHYLLLSRVLARRQNIVAALEAVSTSIRLSPNNVGSKDWAAQLEKRFRRG